MSPSSPVRCHIANTTMQAPVMIRYFGCTMPTSFPTTGIIIRVKMPPGDSARRSEEHTSELQSQSNLVCRLLLEKKKNEATGTTRTAVPTAPGTTPLTDTQSSTLDIN